MLILATEAPPPLALALEDYVPVLLSITGLILVAGWVAWRRNVDRELVALVAAAVIGLGGLAKASWKLIYAIGPDVTWMDELLFPFLAVGFTTMAVFVARVDRASAPTWAAGAGATIGLLGVAAWGTAGFETAETIWLIGMVTATTTLILLLAAAARRVGARRANAALFVHLFLTYFLAGLARVEAQSWSLQWVEQLANTASQGLFAIAVWWLWQEAKRAAPQQESEEPVGSLTNTIPAT